MNNPEKVENLRRDYRLKALEREELQDHPIAQFRQWFQEACDAQLTEPNAMTLACSDSGGKVSARTVLLKGYDDQGFVFFTNYASRKSKALESNPHVALLFPWLDLERQVEVNGTAKKISKEESIAYYTKRPLGSQVGAWASRQSSVISSRSDLENTYLEMMQTYQEGKVPFPDFWGGWRVIPQEIEFWQGRSNRLHDRFRYRRQSDDSWNIDRLAP